MKIVYPRYRFLLAAMPTNPRDLSAMAGYADPDERPDAGQNQA
jgi:hypothetical protein